MARTRERIVAAARTGELHQIVAAMETSEPMPVFSFTQDKAPIVFWKTTYPDSEGIEMLAILLSILETGFVHVDQGTPQEVYVWPYFARMPLKALTPQQKVELFRIVTGADYKDMVRIRRLFLLSARHRAGRDLDVLRLRGLRRPSSVLRIPCDRPPGALRSRRHLASIAMKAALLPDRGVVKVAGEDARKFLNGLVTADMGRLRPDAPRFAALLTPQGKIIADFIVAQAAAEDGVASSSIVRARLRRRWSSGSISTSCVRK